jgi:hypothetical protein
MLNPAGARREPEWTYLKTMEGFMDSARKLLKSGRRREALRQLESAATLKDHFHSLHGITYSRSQSPSAGLPAGDKD